MRYGFALLLLISYASLGDTRAGQPVAYNHLIWNDSIHPNAIVKNETGGKLPAAYAVRQTNNFPVTELLLKRVASRGQLGYSRKGRPVNAYYFPGSSDRKALVIGGVHGSELSAIEIAKKLARELENKSGLYYNVVVIPCLFPDNEFLAENADGKKVFNHGRYSDKKAVDPNRQMPPLGKPFDEENPVDFLGRPIEEENRLLLSLIHEYQPDRIINLHAINNINRAGIFADPRTDFQGYALGFESDSTLALRMAKAIYEKGGNVAGNQLDGSPTALYYNDPHIVPVGAFQPRNLAGAKIALDRGHGISLGSWASTAVCDSARPAFNRMAIRLITVEFPGYKRPADYTHAADQHYYRELLDLYTSSILTHFFTDEFQEDKTDPCICAASKASAGQVLRERK